MPRLAHRGRKRPPASSGGLSTEALLLEVLLVELNAVRQAVSLPMLTLADVQRTAEMVKSSYNATAVEDMP